MVGSSTANAALWEGIKNKYANKLDVLEEEESELRGRVQALERLADRGPDPCLCDNKKTQQQSHQTDFQCPPIDLNSIPKVVDECPCKPCTYKNKYKTDQCACTGNTDQCNCAEDPPEETKCDCNENKLQALLIEIEKAAPEILARDVQIPPEKPLKKTPEDCECDVDAALKTKILPIIDEMLDEFCSVCDDVKKVFSPLHSKHNCSCLDMLDLSPSTCACLSKNNATRPDSRRRSSNGKRKHPEGCECSSCVCDPCNVGKGSSRIIRTHEQTCECIICECDSCGLQAASKSRGGVGCSCDSPGGRRNSLNKPAGLHGSKCECIECVCEPCSIQPNRGGKTSSSNKRGCQCGDSAHRNVSTPRSPTADRRRGSIGGCSCVEPSSRGGGPRPTSRGGPRPTSPTSRGSSRPTSATSGSSYRPSSPTSRPTSRHDPNCDCIECLCDPCNVSLNFNKPSSRSGKGGCMCDDSGSRQPIKLLPSRPSTNGGRRDSKSKGKCVCDSRDVAGQTTKTKTNNHGPNCDCDSCVCDSCGIPQLPSQSAGKHDAGCECNSCVCDPCGGTQQFSQSAGKHDAACDCNSCMCDPCVVPKQPSQNAAKHGAGCDCVICECESCGPGDSPSKPTPGPSSDTDDCACDPCGSDDDVNYGGKGMVDCGCDPCSFEPDQKAPRRSSGAKSSSKAGSRIPVPQGCICREPCPCDTCFFDNNAMEELTKSVIGKDSCSCRQGMSKGVRTKLTNARNHISNMSVRSADIGHMKEIIQMYNEQKSLKRRIKELESKRRNIRR